MTLRRVTPEDVAALFRVFGDADVCRYWSRAALPDMDAAEALQREIDHLFTMRTLFQWGMADQRSDALIGTCTLAEISAEHRRAAVGFAVRRDLWSRGYATEALEAMVGFAFNELGLRRLEADADPRNAGSIRVLERAGFQREGRQRERLVVNGEVQDAVLFGLLRREWPGSSMASRAGHMPVPAAG